MLAGSAPEELDDSIARMEQAVESIIKARSRGSTVLLYAAEVDLLKRFEQARDVMLEFMKNSRNRGPLLQLFGGDCMRIARIRAVLDSAEFSAVHVNDQRTSLCLKACRSVEDVLKDTGLEDALRRAQHQESDMLGRRQLETALEEVGATVEELGIVTKATGAKTPTTTGSEPSPVSVEEARALQATASCLKSRQVLSTHRKEAGEQGEEPARGGADGARTTVLGRLASEDDLSSTSGDDETRPSPQSCIYRPDVVSFFPDSKIASPFPTHRSPRGTPTSEPSATMQKDTRDAEHDGHLASDAVFKGCERPRGPLKQDLLVASLCKASLPEPPEEPLPGPPSVSGILLPAGGGAGAGAEEARQDRCLTHIAAAILAESAGFELDTAGLFPGAIERYGESAREFAAAARCPLPAHERDLARVARHHEAILARRDYLRGLAGEEPVPLEKQVSAVPLHIHAATATSAMARLARAGDPEARAACAALAEGGAARLGTVAGCLLLGATRGGSIAVSCRTGHSLRAFVTPIADYSCNSCGRKFPHGSVLWGCQQCDFDLCIDCVGVQADRPRIFKLMGTGELSTLALRAFQEQDVLNSGFLVGEQVPAALREVFCGLRLEPPTKKRFRQLCSGAHRQAVRLEMAEFPGFVEALCREFCGIEQRQQHEASATLQPPSLTSPLSQGCCGQGSSDASESQSRHAGAIREGELRQAALQAFQSRDTESLGFLEWNDGGIRYFIASVFQFLKLPTPSENEMYAIYSKFDAGGAWRLDLCDCYRFVETLCSSLYNLESEQGRQAALALSTGTLAAAARQVFTTRCPEGGSLRWSDDEVLAFVLDAYRAVALDPPTEQQLLTAYSRLGFGLELSLEQCLQLAETLCADIGRAAGAETGALCALGHAMQLFATPRADFSCNACGAIFPKNSMLWQCRPCDFDLCVGCSKRMKQTKAAASCPGGHAMGIFRTPAAHYSCDVCGSTFPQHTTLWSCRPCNFDMCARCTGGARPRRPSKAGEVFRPPPREHPRET